jgi:hypothetical protein
MADSGPRRADGLVSGLLIVDMTHVLNGPFGTTVRMTPACAFSAARAGVLSRHK